MCTNIISLNVGDMGTNTLLHFEVSKGLKSVIGRDLITDDEVAIFELVKNSFDAKATKVKIYFTDTSIYVIDDGNGMTYEDLTEKWLVVAYSAKKEENRIKEGDFRHEIADRKHYAGSKGIGRFSSDRLGERLIVQTRAKADPESPVHRIEVDWALFEKNAHEQFDSVPVQYQSFPHFELPDSLVAPDFGTIIEISEPRFIWRRDQILHLKASLAKLINPFGEDVDGFEIEIEAPAEAQKDLSLKKRLDAEDFEHSIVNGPVGNFIFSTLSEKTTFIRVDLDEDGTHFVTSLVDRGEEVYRIREPNPFRHLNGSNFHCQIYYLNQSAKQTFARRMGLPSVKFGSVFLFRNGFRVFPIGEPSDDWFGVDARKQQGYARYLGSRDVIGRVDVTGSEEHFREASSRNQGLIESSAVSEMRECFWEYCLKRLEKYVVPVSWGDGGEKLSEDLSLLLTDSGRSRVANAVAKLVDSPDIEVLSYSKRLIGILNERSSMFESSLESLRAIAEKTNDKDLQISLEQAERRFVELKAAELEAKRIAEEERVAKERAQLEAREAAQAVRVAEESLEEERRRNLFLTSLTSLDPDTIINMHHQITIYAADLMQKVENCIAAARSETLSPEDIVARLEQVAFLNQKVLSIARIATKANFRLESDQIQTDLAQYICQYIKHGVEPFLGNGMQVVVEEENVDFPKRFSPMEVAIIIDNLVHNAKKANATEIKFKFLQKDKKSLSLIVSDNGTGLASSITEPERVFELGFSRTSGSGIGLYHVRQIIDELGGGISIKNNEGARGVNITIRFQHET
ncbi:ATP-binding protein [Herbaspirillum seropedicae]|uniref:ATP-binding protein n=1 Tax=Herbaspirillum seropedicae TaxID=964 RepID=UPI00285DA9E1|nr:ATP-binding protein [Herbaspirillum seropedicae]MDR6397273.1 signal transduction histidine kinase [Herbaspirillum seropedicae]